MEAAESTLGARTAGDRADPPPASDEGASARRAAEAAALFVDHGAALRRVARRLSICATDADDAVQRAAEILLRKGPEVERRRLIAWMRVVTRREALAVRRERERLLGSCAQRGAAEAIDPLELIACAAPTPDERLERGQRVLAARDALAALKPNERLAIVLQALGYSYAEICEHCGWTYTKVNRLLAEGRARLRSRVAADGPRRHPVVASTFPVDVSERVVRKVDPR